MRALETELLDCPDCDPALAAASYRFMAIVNRFFGGWRVVRRFLETELIGRRRDAPCHILDIGSGGCDIPLAASRWARARGHVLRFTCLEKSDGAERFARDRLARAGDPAVTLIQDDVFLHTPAEPYDYALASMTCHHFDDATILALLRRLRGFVRYGVLINDLRRTRLALLAVRPLLILCPAGVRHDALLSIQRGFRVRELRHLLSSLEDASVSVAPAPWFRVAAVIRFG